MKRIIFVFICFFLVATTVHLSIAADEKFSELIKARAQVTLYLKSGEVIKGKLADKTDEKIVISKYGSLIPFPLDGIFKVTESETGAVLLKQSRYSFSTAIITYEYKGRQKAKEMVYIDAAENKVAIEHAVNMGLADLIPGAAERTIYDGETAYMIRSGDNKVIKMEQMGNVISDIFMEQFYFGHPVTKQVFLGKECNVYAHPMGKAYFWEGLLLKSETAIPGDEGYNMVKEATDIQVDVDIPSEKFELPEGAKVMSWAEMMKDFGGMAGETEGSLGWEEEYQQQRKEHLLEQAQFDPEIEKILKEATKEDGTLDLGKTDKLLREKEERDLLAKAKKLKGGEDIINAVTSSDGKIDMHQLRSRIWKKESQLREEARKLRDAARVYQEQDDYDTALAKLNEAIEVYSLDGLGYYERAQLYEARGEDQKAIQDLTALLKNKDLFSQYSRPMYFSQRAGIYTRIGKYEEAVNDYSETLKMQKEIIKKEIQRKQKILKESGEDEIGVDRSKLSYRPDLHTLKERGDVYRKMGKFKEAIADFTELIDSGPDKWLLRDTYFLRGLIFKQTGKTKEMKADWDKAKSLGDKLVEGEYIRGKKQGRFVWYYPDGGVKCDANYADGEQEDLATWYYNNGQLKCTGKYHRGEKEGIFTWYDRLRGYKTKELNYVQGKLEGECRWYYDDGGLWEKSTFRNGARQGLSYKYYEKGKLQQVCPMEKGLENGECVLYNQDGSLKKKILFENGKRIKDIYE